MKEVVPVRQERKDGDGCQCRLRQWQQNPPEDLPTGGAVDNGGLVQIPRNLQEELPEEEDAERSTTEPRRQNERPPGVDPCLSEERQRYEMEHQELRNDDHFLRQHK